jgi:hypothetical protein
MAAIAATNSATPSIQVLLMQRRVESARREADQAESYAKTLQAQVQDQERVVVQARDRVQTLEKGANQTSTASVSNVSVQAERSPASSTQTTPPAVTLEQKSTYTGILADVFQVAKPILNSNLNTNQKNLVKSSLINVANHTWSASQTNAKVQITYGTQSANPPHPFVGQVLNTSA